MGAIVALRNRGKRFPAGLHDEPDDEAQQDERSERQQHGKQATDHHGDQRQQEAEADDRQEEQPEQQATRALAGVERNRAEEDCYSFQAQQDGRQALY